MAINEIYSDPENPGVARSATRALRESLEMSLENACGLQDMWEIFQNYVRSYEHGIFVDSLISGIEGEIKENIKAEKSSALYLQALDDVRVEISQNPKIYIDLENEIRESIKEQVRAKLAREVEPQLRQAMHAQISNEIRPEVEVKLRGDLMTDPEFIASVKADLQRKMLGL